MKIMKHEFDFGREYAESIEEGFGSPVDIDQIVKRPCEIPSEDYLAMKREGIENPDDCKYWEGFNSYFLKEE